MGAMLLLGQDTGWFAGLGALGLVFMLIGLLLTVFWLWMLVSALMNEPTTGEKLLWFLVIFLLHFLGALIYYFMRHSSRGRPAGTGL
jgi:hypothetical protein